MFGYLEGLAGGSAIENLVKKYNKAIKSLIDEFPKFNEHYAIIISCNIFSLF